MNPDKAIVPGKIIILNGTSSAGKSTICAELQKQLSEVWCYYAADQLADGKFRDPCNKETALDHEMPAERMRFFNGFHASIPSFASQGNNLIVEHIIEFDWWLADLVRLLNCYDVFFVGVHCPLQIIEQRERQRGNRQNGEAAYHLKTHDYCTYDFEVDSREPAKNNATKILTAWQARQTPSAFTSMSKIAG